uniref:Uncharacterized protein n=1 Tax=Setaria viridis TaxID=4556 RepID=A0A4U6VVU5_SETVI|nr:hypothetical protein SEVIR_3G367700v2 [Setaria viridis]
MALTQKLKKGSSFKRPWFEDDGILEKRILEMMIMLPVMLKWNPQRRSQCMLMKFSDGWFILQYIAWWDSPRNVHIYTDAITVRCNFFIDLLVHEANAWRTRLPGIVKHYL